jgi:hypothetical protein
MHQNKAARLLSNFDPGGGGPDENAEIAVVTKLSLAPVSAKWARLNGNTMSFEGFV